MPKFTCLLPGKELPDLKEDFKNAQRLEQYRLGKLAVYLPRGLSWEYLPLTGITRAERSRRVITAGHCVTVREEKPAVDLWAGESCFTLNLERPASARIVLDALGRNEEERA
jgi:hypothetical protein